MSTRERDSLSTDLHVEATYRLTEALVEAENRMTRRVNMLSEVVFETDLDGALVFLNRAWTTALGRPLEACLGHALTEFVHADDRDACRAILNGPTLAGVGRPRLRFTRADGGTAWMEMTASQLPGDGVVGALHDVTVEKHAQDELAKLSLVASYTDNLVVMTDREGRTEWVNQAFVKSTGYTLEDMLGRKPGDVLQGPDTDPSTVAQIGEWLRDGRSFKAELLNYTKAGKPYWVLFQVSPIRDASGEVERFVAIQTDSTELHRTRQELEAAKEHAEQASAAKTQFLATISHEMRTPLNAILGSSELVREDPSDPENPTHVQRIQTSAEALLRLISDMLDVSKIEAGQVDFEYLPVDVRTCFSMALAATGERAREKGLAFELEFDGQLPGLILGDPDRLRQMVTNLAENAVKFTDTGFVHVAVAPLPIGPGGRQQLEIRVSDSGIGISPEAQTRVFERFEQGDSSTTRRKGGAGLGLNIVKSLAEALGGHVGLRSTLGEGAEFRVVLPLQIPAAATPAAAPEPLPPTEVADARAGTRVLVAEDTEANFAVLRVFLSKAGYTVLRARNGIEAVEAASRADMILMDVEMPEMDGLEATSLIRARERVSGRPPVPILALTAHAVQGYRERCLAAGCSAYLSKPVRRDALLAAVAAGLCESTA